MLRFVVMAAGRASRMGQDKLAMPWEDTTILGHVLRTLKEALLKYDTSIDFFGELNSCEIVVVAPKACSAYGLSEEWNFSLKGGCQWIQSTAGQPLADTIRMGLEIESDDICGACFVPGDQVGIDPQTLTAMIRYYLEKKPDFLIPKESEVTGSPVFFHPRYFSDLLNLQGEQAGRHVLNCYKERWVTYPVREGFFLDIDTMAEYMNHYGE